MQSIKLHRVPLWPECHVGQLVKIWKCHEHAGEQGTGTPFGLLLWFNQNSILDTTPLYNVASLPVYWLFPW